MLNDDLLAGYTAKRDIKVCVKMDSDTLDFVRIVVYGLNRNKAQASDLLGITPIELISGLNRLLACPSNTVVGD